MRAAGVIGAEFLVGSVWRNWDCTVTTVAGNIGAGGTAQRFASHLQWLSALGARYLVVDLRAVRDCDAQGLNALLTARDQALARQGWVCVSGCKALLDQLTGWSDCVLTPAATQIDYGGT